MLHLSNLCCEAITEHCKTKQAQCLQTEHGPEMFPTKYRSLRATLKTQHAGVSLTTCHAQCIKTYANLQKEPSTKLDEWARSNQRISGNGFVHALNHVRIDKL